MTNETIIPRVNASATDRNREQTKRILALKGLKIKESLAWPGIWHPWDKDADYTDVLIIDGSFTLCVVVGMLEAEEITWHNWGWVRWLSNGNYLPINKDCARPHDLTAAMDALIKVLEEKGEKE